MSERHKGVEVGKDDAAHTIFWIHGYTGSPDAFAPTAQRFSEELDAKVMVPLLPGHGTEESHLAAYGFEDFLASTRHLFERALERKKPIALVGYSFGGYLAMTLAVEYAPVAMVLALAPYRLRFPFWLPGISSVVGLLPFWGKHLSEEDVRLRQGTFYYPDLPGKSLSLIKEGNARAAKMLPKIHCPILTFHNDDDPLADPSSGTAIIEAAGNHPESEHKIFPRDRHTFFMGEDRKRDEEVVIGFLARQFKKGAATKQSLAAGR